MPKKFLDANGLTYFAQLLDNYPNNEILATVIDAIGEELEKKSTFSGSYNDLTDKPFIGGSTTINSVDTSGRVIATIGDTDIYIEDATSSISGLMSAENKQTLDNLNPHVTVTISDNTTSEIHFINAKAENAIDFVGTVEEPLISSQIRTDNLLNVNAEGLSNAYLNASGGVSNSNNDITGNFIEVTPGDDIYYTGIVGETSSTSINRRLHIFDSNQKWIKQLDVASGLRAGSSWKIHGVVPSDGAYVRVSWGTTDYNVMISVGEPEAYEPYYITPFDTYKAMSIYVADNQQHTNANIYSFNIPAVAGDVYGFKYNPIQGKLWTHIGHINSYNGETLTTRWWSDRNDYIEGTNPSIGAEVIYVLNDDEMVEYDFAPIDIPLFYQNNYVYVNNGIITDLSYSAETLAVTHLTIRDAVTFGDTDIKEVDVQNWQNTYNDISTKANIDSPAFTGAPTAVTPNMADTSNRLATTSFVQRAMENIAPVENSTKATKNYNIGDYLMNKGQLYKVTATIVSGQTLNVGTNIEATDIATELDLIDGGASAITIDSALSSTSTNPVQNKIIYNKLQDYATKTYVDNKVATGSAVYIEKHQAIANNHYVHNFIQVSERDSRLYRTELIELGMCNIVQLVFDDSVLSLLGTNKNFFWYVHYFDSIPSEISKNKADGYTDAVITGSSSSTIAMGQYYTADKATAISLDNMIAKYNPKYVIFEIGTSGDNTQLPLTFPTAHVEMWTA